jgi:CheY-like chemotaxis protein
MLGVILGYAQLAMLKIGADEPLYANLEAIRKAAERSADLTRQLLAFARKQTVAPKVLDLNKTVNDMLKMLRRLIGENMDLAWRPGRNLGSVFIDPSQLDQILTNLCVNARDAVSNTGRITIETANVCFDEAYRTDHADFIPGDFVMLAVSDDGCGMDATILDHIFEPFFSTKEMGKGTGLGLATVYGIVRQNNGFINVYSEPGHGTTFKIYLPQHAAEADPRSEQEQFPVVATGGETILLVEDEPAILEMATIMLEEMGYAVIAAGSPDAAIRLAREHLGRIDLLITDVVMPEMNGRDLAGSLMPLCPDIKRLYMSGYTANVIAHHGVLDPDVHFLQKPFSMEDLAQQIRQVLDE